VKIFYYSFRPPVVINASGEIDGQKFILSAIPGPGGMACTIRSSADMTVALKITLPSDITRPGLEKIVTMVLDAMAQEEAA
jgi:hypothetical protein